MKFSVSKYLGNYLIGNRALLEKLTGPQLDKKFREFYGNRIFFPAVTTARPLSIS